MIESPLADQFLQIKAQQAVLSKQEETLKAQLLALNSPVIEGSLARVTIVEQTGRTSYDTTLLAKYVPSGTLQLCQKTGKRSKRFEVHGRSV